jgi:hypothetical protein
MKNQNEKPETAMMPYIEPGAKTLHRMAAAAHGHNARRRNSDDGNAQRCHGYE